MPYIKPEERSNMDKVVNFMINHNVKPDGKLNYVLYKLCKEIVDPSYNNYKNFLGELTECCEEIRRRLLSKYEDNKIIENGDVE
jgi:hypothetical protein